MTDSNSDVVLEVRNLQTSFMLRAGPLRAVDDVSFSLERGKTTCIVGESGSGKSVTARSILQIVDPPGRIVGGEVLLHRGRTSKGAADGGGTVNLAAMHPRSREIRSIRGRDIAMIFQEPMSSLNPALTVGMQIAEPVNVHRKEPGARAFRSEEHTS